MGSMTPLSTLEGIQADHDVAIQTGALVQRWRVTADGGLTRDGHRLEPFFLSGLLAGGRIFDGDFSPPQPREWFDMNGRKILVLAIEGDIAHCCAFRNGDFYRWVDEQYLVEHGRRTDTPEWASTTLFQMCLMAWNSVTEIAQFRDKQRKMSQARDYMRYVTDYARTARELMEP